MSFFTRVTKHNPHHDHTGKFTVPPKGGMNPFKPTGFSSIMRGGPNSPVKQRKLPSKSMSSSFASMLGI